MNMKKRITIKDIAYEANVSIATVSKVLNNKDEHISYETKESIKRISKELGYIPNTFAKGLKIDNSKTLGLIMPNISNAFPEMAQGAEDEATKYGYSLIFTTTNENQLQEERCIHIMISKMVDGIIYVTSNLHMSEQMIVKSAIPLVTIDRTLETKNNNGEVVIDNYKAMFDVAEFMVANNCKRIAHITADINKTPCVDRFKGLCDGLEKHGMKFDKKLLYSGNFNVETGHIGAMTILQRDNTIDSIVCGNDLIAIGAMNALHQLKIKIPEQVKVIGFDDVFIARYTNPELTTVRQNIYEMGRLAARMLINHLENGKKLRTIVLEHEIIMRGSV